MSCECCIAGIVRRLAAGGSVAVVGLFLLASSPVALAETTPAATEGAAASSETVLEKVGEAEAALEEGHAEEGHGGGAGMPQLESSTYTSQIIWLVITFGVLYWLLRRKALPRVAEILEARQDRIAADLDRAAALRADAEAAQQKQERVVAEAHARAQAQVKELTERSAAEAAKRQAALDAELAQKLKDAEGRIGASREAALAEVRNVAAEVAEAAVERLAGLKVSRAEVDAAIERTLREAA
ncbi:MAG: ATPase [Geminicoccaceae bacterium]